ncbi:MAG: NAD(P)/FAD-dependent oxidoreductase, partial [Candidatus Geothermincolia bacterium]
PMYDLIIVGAGPAGLAAAVYSARKLLKTLIVSKDVGGQAAWSSDVENYLGYQYVSGIELVEKFREHVEEFDLELEEGSDVKELRPVDGAFAVEMEDGRVFDSQGVIIAAGKRPRELGVPGEAEFLRRGITYCATCDAPLFPRKDVAVVGGGNSALDAAIQLGGIANQVYLLVLNDALDADPVLQEEAKSLENVHFLMRTQVTGISGQLLVEQLTYRDLAAGEERQLAVQGVFIEIGSIPATEWLRGLIELNQWNEIQVDCDNRTNVPGVFAAGDITSVSEKQIIVAAGEGAKAALVAYKWLLSNQKIEKRTTSRY